MTTTLHDLLKSYREGGVFPSYDQLAAIAGQDQSGAAVRGEAVAELVPKFAGQFNTHQEWVNKAASWLKSPDWNRPICVDSLGRRMAIGIDMAKARDEGTFPVRYFWECELAPVSDRAADAPSEPSELRGIPTLRDLAELFHASAMSNTAVLIHPESARSLFDAMTTPPKDESAPLSYVCRVELHQDRIILDDKYESIDTVRTALAKSRAADALDSQPGTDEPTERESLIACLGDDAVTLLRANPDDEMAQTMREAAAMLENDGKALDSQPTVSAVLAELRADLRELANNTEAFGEYSQEAARVALDSATDKLDEVAAKYASSQPTDGGVRNG